jgi:hypothetical protein
MLNFFMYFIGSLVAVFLLAVTVRYGLKGAGSWDERISYRQNRSFRGFNWFFRIPFAIGVVPEFYFFLVLGNNNYFKTNWWALKAAAFVTFMLFLAGLSNRGDLALYYSFAAADAETPWLALSSLTFWYLSFINLLYLSIFVMVIIESIRMHGWLSPVRIGMYGLLSVFISVLTFFTLSMIILFTLLYVAYKIIKFLFFSSSRKRRAQEDEDDDVSEKLNNSYRIFRAELYAWEDELKGERKIKAEENKPKVKRKRPKIIRKPIPKRKPRAKDDDIPRFYPE